jgi:hypothetical protein
MKIPILFSLMIYRLLYINSNLITEKRGTKLSKSNSHFINKTSITLLRESLNKQTKENLQKYALEIDKYNKELNSNVENAIDLHHFIKNLNKEETIIYIINEVEKFPELCSFETLNSLVFGTSKDKLKLTNQRNIREFILFFSKGNISNCVSKVEDYIHSFYDNLNIYNLVKKLEKTEMINLFITELDYFSNKPQHILTNCETTINNNSINSVDYRDFFLMFDNSVLNTYAKVLKRYISEITIEAEYQFILSFNYDNGDRNSTLNFIKKILQSRKEIYSLAFLDHLRKQYSYEFDNKNN